MLIGELARRAGLSPKAIRYYEAVGLLPPARRTTGGYRDFGQEAATRLAFIRSARTVGFHLSEIAEILASRDRGEVPCDRVAKLTEDRLMQVDRRIAELVGIRSELERVAARAHTLSPDDCRKVAYCHLIEDRITS